MRFLSLYRVELRRLILTKQIWLISAICLCVPMLGYTVYIPVRSVTMTALYIGNPVLAGTAAGSVLWAIAVIADASRQFRSGTDILAASAAPPLTHSAAKAAALITISASVTILCALVYLPFTSVKLDYLFNTGYYFLNFLVFMLPTWWISILFADGFYRITRRVELSAVLYAALAYMSYSRLARRNYFLKWINPIAYAYSDGFPDVWFQRMGAYTRLVWLCIAAGVWMFSLICLRKYQKGLPGSFVRGLKKVYLPIGMAALITVGAVLWNNQPFIGNGADEYILYDGYNYPLNPPTGAMTGVKYSVKVDTVLGTLSGTAEYRITTSIKGESVLRLNAGYKIKSITYGGERVNFRTVEEDINGQYDTYFELPEKYREKLIIEYGGFPSVAQCHMPGVHNSIGENYIYLEHTDIVPFLADYGLDYGTVDFEVTLPNTLTPFLYFEPITKYVQNSDGTRTYSTILGDTYIFNFIVGNYVTDTFSSNDINFRFVYGDVYRSAVEEYNVRQSICDVYDYCTEHYGKSPYTGRGLFTLFQLSSMKMGGYATQGSSTWFEDVISPNTLSDPNRGANATEVFIHEMIHQWWGGVGVWCEDDDVWSAEGLTVYATYRLVKEKYGELYAKQYYVDEWTKAVAEQDRNFYNRYPEYLEKLPEHYREQLSAANQQTNHYKRMPLMILKAEKLVGGEEKMDEILSRIYSDYYNRDGQYNVTYKDFLDYCGLTEEDLKLD
ncbi:MAG: hypothetical protein K2O65_16085 [Lachnospiraceae bacterium]|nr:hypothetical protein [Lachnospiraceae bacterium]